MPSLLPQSFTSKPTTMPTTSFPTTDIKTDADIALLVKVFEQKAQQHALATPGPVAEQEKQERLMFRYWRSVLLEAKPYLQHPLVPYAFLQIPAGHIGRWIHLFYETLEENFNGSLADIAKARASNLARLLHLPSLPHC